MARTGQPFVKRFREERDQLLLLVLDVSKSMRFGALGAAKSRVAAHTTALLAAAAGHAGDRVGLIAFDDRVREQVDAARGPAHTWRLIRAAVARAEASGGETRLASAIEGALETVRRRATVMLISDFRDPELAAAVGVGRETLPDPARREGRALRSSLVALSRRHDLVSIVLSDPREETLPRVGLIRISDPEQPQTTLLIDSSSARARAGYERAWAQRRRSLDRGLRALGSDLLWLRTDRNPLRRLMIHFAQRAGAPQAARR